MIYLKYHALGTKLILQEVKTVSIMVKIVKYVLALGLAETDDVICNTIGCGLEILANIFRRKVSNN